MRAVADAGPIIHLSWIDRFDILFEIFEEVTVPVAVRDEVLNASADVPGITAIRAGLERGRPAVLTVLDVTAVRSLRASIGLDAGEAEALVLAREMSADIILLDDGRARSYAAREGFPMTGTLGILRRARELGLVTEVAPLLTMLVRRGFRVSESLVVKIVREDTRGR